MKDDAHRATELEIAGGIAATRYLLALVAQPFARPWMEQMRQLLLVVAVVSVAAPALASDEQDCFQGQQPQQRIEGCSALIQRAPNDATDARSGRTGLDPPDGQ